MRSTIQSIDTHQMSERMITRATMERIKKTAHIKTTKQPQTNKNTKMKEQTKTHKLQKTQNSVRGDFFWKNTKIQKSQGHNPVSYTKKNPTKNNYLCPCWARLIVCFNL